MLLILIKSFTTHLVLTYDGTSACNGRIRSGSISLQLLSGAHWSSQNAKVAVTFNNYTVTRVSDGKALVFSGTKYITNVSGGLVTTLPNDAGSIIHKVQSNNLQVKFDNGTTRTWGIAYTRTITRQSTYAFTISTSGDSTVSAVSGVAAAGTTRLGSSFYTVINTPIVRNTANCTTAPVSGERTIKGVTREVTIDYGVDQNGAPVTSGCPYGAKLSWTDASGNARTAIVQY